MARKNIDLLIVKYFDNQITEVELLELQTWAHKNKSAFKRAVQLDLDIQKSVSSNMNSEKGFEIFKEEITYGKARVMTLSKKRYLKQFLKYAALILTLCTLGSWYFFRSNERKPAMVIVGVSKEIKLELGDGSVKIITEGKAQQILNNKGKLISTQGKEVLTYTATSTKMEILKETYNTLSIPYGRTFKIVLSDGTRVALNAGSSLRYPIRFWKEGPRRVYLDGEGYFEVTKNTAQPFIVTTTTHDIKVLGTRFNVNSYKEENTMETVLVAGAVEIYSLDKTSKKNKVLLLKPKQKASWDSLKGRVTVSSVETAQYTAWVDGGLLFVNTPFLKMIRQIERHYNVTIQNNYKALEGFVFTATFEHENIDQVMRAIKLYGQFSYSINNNHIIINQTLNNKR